MIIEWFPYCFSLYRLKHAEDGGHGCNYNNYNVFFFNYSASKTEWRTFEIENFNRKK